MPDPRLQRWAYTLVHYSLELKSGDVLMIETTPLAAPLVEAVYVEALKVGAQIIPHISLEKLDTLLVQHGNDDQLQFVPPHLASLFQTINAFLFIYAEEDVNRGASLDPARYAIRHKALTDVKKLRTARYEHGLRTCLTLYPTHAYAVEADMNDEEFTEFVYASCFLNDEDPIARWEELGREQQRLVDFMKGKKTVHIQGRGTNLTMSIEGRPFINSLAKRNFPSGEIYTGPVEDSVNGEILYSLPCTFNGRVVEGARLTFKDGEIVHATADIGEEFLRQMIALDEGSRRLGELGIGSNFNIQRASKKILFDEKIAGSVHTAIGYSLPGTGGVNKSSIHWDLICDLRDGGTIHVDDILFLENGKIVI